MIWFDQNKEADWRIDSSTTALAAYQQVVASSLGAESPRPVRQQRLHHAESADSTSPTATGRPRVPDVYHNLAHNDICVTHNHGSGELERVDAFRVRLELPAFVGLAPLEYRLGCSRIHGAGVDKLILQRTR